MSHCSPVAEVVWCDKSKQRAPTSLLIFAFTRRRGRCYFDISCCMYALSRAHTFAVNTPAIRHELKLKNRAWRYLSSCIVTLINVPQTETTEVTYMWHKNVGLHCSPHHFPFLCAIRHGYRTYTGGALTLYIPMCLPKIDKSKTQILHAFHHKITARLQWMIILCHSPRILTKTTFSEK